MDRGPFVGRSLELGELSRGLARMFAGYGQLFLLEGEPGIGKTSLAENFALDAAAGAARLLWASCSDSPQAPALWPWLQLVHGYLHRDHPAKARVQSQKRSALQLGRAADGISALDELFRLPSDAAQIDFLQFNSIATFLKDAARKRPLILVLDAFEAADNASLRMLRFLAGQLRESRIMMVAAYRMGAFRLSASSGVSGELINHGCWVPLRGLSEAEVRTLVEKLVGNPPDDRTVASIHEASGGNPLMVNHLVRLHLADRAGQSIARCVAASSWNGLHLVTENHIAPLSAPTRELLQVAAAIGSEFDLTALKGTSSRSSREIFDALAEAESLGLVTELEGMPERRYRFTHGLVRDALCKEHDAGLTGMSSNADDRPSAPGGIASAREVHRPAPNGINDRGSWNGSYAGDGHRLNRRFRLSGRVRRTKIFSAEKASIGRCASGIHCSGCGTARVWHSSRTCCTIQTRNFTCSSWTPK